MYYLIGVFILFALIYYINKKNKKNNPRKKINQTTKRKLINQTKSNYTTNLKYVKEKLKKYLNNDIKSKGEYGENVVKNILNTLPNEDYALVKNVMLKTEKGTTQVDFVLVSSYGVFVIEVKNYSGVVNGSYKSSNWAQVLKKRRFYFMNPIHQNYAHIKAIEKLIGRDDVKIYSLVVFVGNVKLNMYDVDEYKDTFVLLDTQLKDKILSLSTEKIMDENYKYEIYANINLSDIDHIEKINEHNEQIKIKKENIEKNICPRCSGDLIEKKGKYGSFLGCKNFPKCRYTQKL